MKHPQLASRVRSHRKKSGLSQKDLARIVGLAEARVSRHERFGIVPPLSIALSYEARIWCRRPRPLPTAL